MKNISVATRIAIAIMLVAVTAVTVTFLFGMESLGRLFTLGTDVRFEATRAGKVDELDRYLKTLGSETAQIAASPMTSDALSRFAAAYAELPATTPNTDQEAIDTLLPIYRDRFLPRLTEATSRQVTLASVLPQTGEALYLQTIYFGAADSIGIDPSGIDDAADGSLWSGVHAEFQPVYRELAHSTGVDDIIFVDATTSAIVYSMEKKTDFGTNLETGPGSGSTLATVVGRVLRNPERGTISAIDFARYTPDFAAPMAFFATPVYDGERLVGVLAMKISTEGINRTMTQAGDWQSIGLGKTGEVFIVGSDGRFRSDARAFVEDPGAYFTEAVAAGTLAESDVPGAKEAGTTALFQRMDTATMDTARTADGAIVQSTNYLGIPVLTTLQPLSFDAVNWNIVVQVSREEIASTVDGAGKASAVTIIMFILILTFISVIWASQFVEPIRSLSSRLRSVVSGNADIDDPAEESANATTREFWSLTTGVKSMAEGLIERDRRLDASLQELSGVVRRFLPDDVVRRMEAGESGLVERISNATVVAIVIGGLGTLTESESADDILRHLQKTIDTFDKAARRHGLQRVKIVGDTYFAVCGLGRPYLDHAPRSVAFAREALETFAGYYEPSDDIDISIGIDSGPVIAGLAGSHRLVYDTWGATVTNAGFLARAAGTGMIAGSGALVEQLPDTVDTAEHRDVPGVGKAWEIAVGTAEQGVPS